METRRQRRYRNYESCECIVCGSVAKKNTVDNPNDDVHYHCINCGDFYVTDEFEADNEDFNNTTDSPKLAGYIRERFECGEDDIRISNENIQDILNNALIPQTPGEKVKKLILYLDRKTAYFSQDVFIDEYDVAACYAKNDDELWGIVEACRDEGYITHSSTEIDSSKEFDLHHIRTRRVRLTMKGSQYAEELKKSESTSNSAFVAMWFSDEVREAYEAGIKAAIEAKVCGQFKAFRVDNLEHNNDVTDEIIAGIKASRFVVADLTGNRGGVYYEAGFARGLGKPVILTCRKDWFKGDDENHKVHFDVDHINIIQWDTAEELKEKLINRIRATIL